jgi:glycosyltransferase involved in cell wall biosynthesis
MGGAENHCARVLSILQREYTDITLLHHGGPLDSELIFNWSGIDLDPSRVRFVSAASKFKLFRSLFNLPLLSYAKVVRKARSMASKADLVISTFGECPIDHANLLQSIHAPIYFFDRESLEYLGVTDFGLISRVARAAYVMLARAIGGWNKRIISGHKTITNSHWTKGQFTRHYSGNDVRAIHHGAKVGLGPTDPKYLPFAMRENNFVILGRAVKNKRIDQALEIVRRLRDDHGHDVSLHIIGRPSTGFETELRRLIANKPWAIWHSQLNRIELEELISSQKWGIHCYRFEHYGLAPAELQHLGCIVFVPDFGGQREIVEDPSLRYRDLEDAVVKIDHVLRTPENHTKRLQNIKNSNARHSIESFERQFSAIVTQLLSSN